MDLTRNAELIFEDRTEATVAAELLEKAGRSDIVDQFVPALSSKRFGYREFIRIQRDERRGIVNDGVHRILEPTITREALESLIKESNTSFRSPSERALRKRDYMGAKLHELSNKSELLMSRAAVLGDIAIAGADAEQAAILTARHEFAVRYFQERDWDIGKPTVDQLVEIQSQPEWEQIAD